MSSIKILITGGAGFLGLALAKSLKNINKDYKPFLLDLPSKFDEDHKGFNIIEGDVRNYDRLKKLEGERFDIIYHLAAQTSAAVSQEDPELDVDTNVKGILNICNLARKVNCKKIIFSSSMAAYGDYEVPINEDFQLKPKSNYGVSKVAGEEYIKMFHQFGLDYTIFRIFNAYGPGQNMLNMKQGMVSIFMSQLIKDGKISTTGGFDRYRDFVYVDDIVSAFCMALDKLDNDVYNVGTGIKVTVSELIEKLITVSGKNRENVEVVNIGGHEGDQYGTFADSSKLLSEGWRPNTSLETGLSKMFDYALKILN